jgi:RNA polymerase sigma factor (sigma-70 family)
MSVREENIDTIAGAQRGDEGAWSDLVKQYTKLVWRATMQYHFPGEEREDIIQQVFCKLVRSIKDYNPNKAQFSTYIAVITKRTCIDRLREIMRNREDPFTPEELADLSHSGKETPIDTIHKQRIIDSLEKAIAENLATEQRLVVGLFYYKGCSYSDIARIMNRDETWVRNTLERARKYLKEILANSVN